MTDHRIDWRLRYAPGDWVVWAGRCVVVVLRRSLDCSSDVIAAMWSDVESARGRADALTALARHGLDRLPDAAIILAEGGVSRCLVRGQVQVRELGRAGLLADGAGRADFVEVDGHGAALRLELSGDGAAGGLLLPLRRGVALCSSLTVQPYELGEKTSPPHAAVSHALYDTPAAAVPPRTIAPAPSAAEPGREPADAVGAPVPTGHHRDWSTASPQVLQRFAAPTASLPAPLPTQASAAGQDVGGEDREARAGDPRSDLRSALDLHGAPDLRGVEEASGATDSSADADRVESDEEVVEWSPHGWTDESTWLGRGGVSDQDAFMYAKTEVLGSGHDAERSRTEPSEGGSGEEPMSGEPAGSPAAEGEPASTPAAEGAPVEDAGDVWEPDLGPASFVPGFGAQPEPGDVQNGEPAIGGESFEEAGRRGPWHEAAESGEPWPQAAESGEPWPQATGMAEDDPAASAEHFGEEPSAEPAPVPGQPSAPLPRPAVNDGSQPSQPQAGGSPLSASKSGPQEPPIDQPPAAPGAQAEPPGPQAPAAVLAQFCPAGHPNRPGSRLCRVCGQKIPDSAPQPVQRPLLADLVTSGGQVFQLDGPVLIGRAPRAQPGEDAAILRVQSPHHDISRTHVRVAPHEWDIAVTDMNSTNGTIVFEVGNDPMRLGSGDTVFVGLGTVIDLGDGQQVSIEAPRG
ncbi:FHA domain-containing protein [Propionibacterium cyclohexanicum]|uniref:FHA domain-containing protein n=1 Tax=Propionibacterium cyclohexanicum TaxID=64702 RepID=A0A1H9RXR8_9ACTN|nr:FHA domain-containing protein [Propionibacterium cyclohexanicum]SER77551.1 FHA domain-containing protein [Propionibacterium cyclohexanicum]